MSVSRLGGRPNPYAAYAAPVRRVRPVEAPGDDLDSLTGSDRELILQVTGLDRVQQTANAFAKMLAAERAAGHLAPGQPVTALYLKDLDRRFSRSAGPNPVRPYLDKAVDYLSRTGGARGIDVSA